MARKTLPLALKHAVATDRLPANPLDRARPPTRRPKSSAPLTADETRAVQLFTAPSVTSRFQRGGQQYAETPETRRIRDDTSAHPVGVEISERQEREALHDTE